MNKSYRVNGKTPVERKEETKQKLTKATRIGALCVVSFCLGASTMAYVRDAQAIARKVTTTEIEATPMVSPMKVTTKTPEEQKYIARYGVTYDWGATIITEDGNMWYLEDAPEYEDETLVRVLFDSNGTLEAEDDIIIDVTER